jgi:diguanylate cyclase (GGDEF)-like protein
MSDHIKAVIIAIPLVAFATVVAALVSQRLDVAIALGAVAVGLLGLGLGAAFRSRPSETATTVDTPADTPTPENSRRNAWGIGPENDDDGVNERVVQFAQDLVAATSTEKFRNVITSHLPTMLGTRRVWIASRSRHGRQVVVPERADGTAADNLLDDDGREWTTFALRVDGESVGVLGIETSGGVTPRVRRLIRQIAPMIAQAMTTAHSVEALRESSLVDLMTGLATRQEGMTRLESEIKRAQRGGTSMAVLMLDLDQFKSINDRFGHAVGDAMLAVVGRTIMRTLRASDIRVRWGGEEFLIVLPETDLPRAQVVASGLLREISSATVTTASGPMASTVSIGITISRPGETDAAAMIRRADMALYHAKAAGRACVRVVLGDRAGHSAPISPAAPADARHHVTTLPFSDRRNPHRVDRRRVPSPGRRSTDPNPLPRGATPDRVGHEDAHVHTGYR